jgi:hypothetical protein
MRHEQIWEKQRLERAAQLEAALAIAPPDMVVRYRALKQACSERTPEDEPTMAARWAGSDCHQLEEQIIALAAKPRKEKHAAPPAKPRKEKAPVATLPSWPPSTLRGRNGRTVVLLDTALLEKHGGLDGVERLLAATAPSDAKGA